MRKKASSAALPGARGWRSAVRPARAAAVPHPAARAPPAVGDRARPPLRASPGICGTASRRQGTPAPARCSGSGRRWR